MRVNQTGGRSQVESSETNSTSRATEATKAQNAKRGSKTSSDKATNTSVNAEISSRAKEFGRAKSVASSAPDVREEKIAELKKRIAEGRYKVDSNAVADRLVDEHLSTADLG